VTPLLAPASGARAELEADGVLAVMELPMLEVKPELTLPLEPWPPFDSGLTREGVLALLPGLDTDGVPEPIEPPIRDVTAESIRPLELRTLELGNVGRPASEETEDGARTEGATGATRLEMLGPILGGALGALGREDTDGLGATVTLGLLRLDELGALGLTGGRIVRELILLLGLRPLEMEGLGARLATGGALTLGAGAGVGADRTAARLLPELESFLSSFAAKMGTQRRIKAEMSATVPILTAPRYAKANMIYLLSVNGPERVLLLLPIEGPEVHGGNRISRPNPDFVHFLCIRASPVGQPRHDAPLSRRVPAATR